MIRILALAEWLDSHPATFRGGEMSFSNDAAHPATVASMSMLRQIVDSANRLAQVSATRRGLAVAPLSLLVAALLVALSTSSPSPADCGDYVTIGGRSAHLAASTRHSGVLGNFGLAPLHLTRLSRHRGPVPQKWQFHREPGSPPTAGLAAFSAFGCGRPMAKRGSLLTYCPADAKILGNGIAVGGHHPGRLVRP